MNVTMLAQDTCARSRHSLAAQSRCCTRTGFLSVMVFIAGVQPAAALDFDNLRLSGSFSLPANTSAFDVFTDGRIIALADDEVFIETARGSATFASQGVLPNADIPFFGPAFLRLSPDETEIAVGNNGGASFSDFEVGIFSVASLAGDWYVANHFTAAWIDDRYLALTVGGPPSTVTALDTDSTNFTNPPNVTIVGGIGGFSGDVTFDVDGNLYTGNGSSTLGPSQTGTIKAFAPSTWRPILSGSSTVAAPDFENDGTEIVEVLSASPLRFDASGNLWVGGGNFLSPPNALAVVNSSAVDDALDGLGAADVTDPARVRLDIDPDTTASDNLYTGIEVASDRVYVTADFTTVFTYIDTVASVPFAGGSTLLLLASGLLFAGVRRRTG